MIEPRVISVEYAAGFFDGEGHLTLRTRSRTSGWLLTVGIGQNDRRPLDLIAAQWGGQVHARAATRGRPNVFHEWRIYSAASRQFLRDIEPFVIVKREVVLAALDFGSGITERPVGVRGLPPEEHARRERCRQRIVSLNAKGMRA